MIDLLRHRLSQDLPGRPAQYKMAHAVRTNYPPPPPDARIACVMALLYPKSEDWHLVLIERMASNPNDRHGGQISFPGGSFDVTDDSLIACALRETQEEVGILGQDIDVIGQLTDLYIPVSNFQVHPFVGVIDYHPTFIPQPSEVKSVLEVPLHTLQKAETIQKTDMRLSGNIILKNVPYYNVDNHIVWGATAMMISEFMEILKD
jgi:8-oxo-dGTP pyrophosphatase MutT (NUDIX family)